MLKTMMIVGAGLISMATTQAAAAPTVVQWTGPDVVGGRATITFAGFEANRFTGIAGSSVFKQGPGSSQRARIQIRVNGQFVDVFTSFYSFSGDLSSAVPAVNFTSGIVDAITLIDEFSGNRDYNLNASSCLFFDACYQNLNSASFSFDNVTAAVPEPSTWALLFIGLSMVAGIARYRRRYAAIVS